MSETLSLGKTAAVETKGNIPFVKVANAAATAEICLVGGHITSFIPKGKEELIWMSPEAVFAFDHAIRGGVPICWPWFSKNDDNPDLPMHGFARTALWTVADVAEGPASTTVHLVLKSSAETKKMWDYDFLLDLYVEIGSTLAITLKTTNLDKKDFVLGEAIHTYFKIGDVSTVSVDGFDGKSCKNKVGEDFTQQGPVFIRQEVDEVFHDSSNDLVIHDPTMKRDILITRENSNSAVVWNPWIAKSHKMSEFPDDGYQTMLCVETTNALKDTRLVKAGTSFTLKTVYEIR